MEAQNSVVNKSKDCVEYFREYCTNTSIHGFRYFGERRTILEKLWWLFIFICCLIICSLSIIAVYNKWENSPVIVTFATKPMRIYEIPFPAVTICSQVKIKTATFNSTKLTGNLSEKEEKFCNYAATMCGRSPFERSYCKKFDFFDDYFDIMEELTPNFFPINCYELGIETDCEQKFTPIITDEGICYTANMLDRDQLFQENVVHHRNFHKIGKTPQWSIEHGYDKKAPVQAYPARALLSGLRYAFQFEVKTLMSDDNDTLCLNSLQGYTVLLHIPSRIPRLSQEQYRLSLDKAVVAAVKPYVITTSSTVIKYRPKTRACYFPSERTLKYFKIYSQNNCQLECLTNYTLALCRCVSYFMPRENGTRICGGQDRLCEIQAEYLYEIKDLSTEPIDEPLIPVPKMADCDCMPMCTDIEYNAVISETDWNWNEEVLKRANFTDNENNSTAFHLSRFSVYFVKSDFIGSERNELYGPTDFLANFGGLLGLFTGFSFLSLMEIIYFLTIRIYANWKLYGFWAGPRPEKP